MTFVSFNVPYGHCSGPTGLVRAGYLCPPTVGCLSNFPLHADFVDRLLSCPLHLSHHFEVVACANHFIPPNGIAFEAVRKSAVVGTFQDSQLSELFTDLWKTIYGFAAVLFKDAMWRLAASSTLNNDF